MKRWRIIGLLLLSGLIIGFSPKVFGAELFPKITRGDTLYLTIEQCIDIALKRNPDIIAAHERLRQAKSQVGEASTAFLPQLTAQAGYTRLDMAPFFPTSKFAMFGGGSMPPGEEQIPKKITIGLPDNFSATLQLQQPIFTGGKIKNSFDISRLAREATENSLRITRKELIYRVKNAYWNLVRAKKFEEVALESERQLSAHLKDVQSMFDVGMAAKNDLLKSKTYYSKAKMGVIKARHAVELARRNLCNLLGIPLEKEIACTTELEEIDTTKIELDSAISKGLSSSPELKALECQKSIAQKQLAISRSGYLPDVFFTANLGYKYPDREYNKDFYTTWTVGFYAQMNIFDWGKTAYKTESARSKLKETEVTIKGARDGIILNITRAYLSVIEAKKEIEVAKEALEQAEENYRVTSEKFKEGLVTNTELLDAQVLLSNAKTDYSNAFINYRLAKADLERAMGE